MSKRFNCYDSKRNILMPGDNVLWHNQAAGEVEILKNIHPYGSPYKIGPNEDDYEYLKIEGTNSKGQRMVVESKQVVKI